MMFHKRAASGFTLAELIITLALLAILAMSALPLGKIYTGKVVRVEEYGAFVEIMPNLVGLLHISEVAPYRIQSIHDVLHLGDTVTVKVVSIDPADNKMRLSKKACEEGGGENPDSTPRPPAPPRRYPREHGPDRRGGRGGGGRF